MFGTILLESVTTRLFKNRTFIEVKVFVFLPVITEHQNTVFLFTRTYLNQSLRLRRMVIQYIEFQCDRDTEKCPSQNI